MTAKAVHVAGIRSFAAEVVDYARDAGLSVSGLIDPDGESPPGRTVHGLPVRRLKDVPARSREVIVGTGDTARRDVVRRLEANGWKPVALVHPRAHLAPSCRLGEGVLVGPGVVVGAASELSEHVVLGRGTLIGHHTEVGAFATLGPGSNVAGNVTVERDAFLGMAAVVRDHVTVGAAAVIAMGAVVVDDVPSNAEVKGIPARASPGVAPPAASADSRGSVTPGVPRPPSRELRRH